VDERGSFLLRKARSQVEFAGPGRLVKGSDKVALVAAK
jgi:hypothetical protein